MNRNVCSHVWGYRSFTNFVWILIPPTKIICTRGCTYRVLCWLYLVTYATQKAVSLYLNLQNVPNKLIIGNSPSPFRYSNLSQSLGCFLLHSSLPLLQRERDILLATSYHFIVDKVSWIMTFYIAQWYTTVCILILVTPTISFYTNTSQTNQTG